MIQLKRLLLASVLSTVSFAQDKKLTLFPEFSDSKFQSTLKSVSNDVKPWGDTAFSINADDSSRSKRYIYHHKTWERNNY